MPGSSQAAAGMVRCPHCGNDHPVPSAGWSLEQVLTMANHPTVAMRRTDAEAFWANFASVDWIDATGRRITDLRAAMLKWKVNQPSHGRRFTPGSSTAAASDPSVAATEKVRIL